MKPLLWITAVVAVVATVAGVVLRDRLTAYLQPETQPAGATSPASANPSTAADDSVWALGRLAPAGGIRDLAALPGDRLLALQVQVGDEVTPETVLGEFESERLLTSERELLIAQIREAQERIASETELANARLDSARLQEEQAREAARLEEEAQLKRIAVLAAVADQAERDLERIKTLAAESPALVSKQELESQQLLWQKAVAEHEAAQATLNAARVSAEHQMRLAEAERKVAELAVGNVAKIVPLRTLEMQETAAAERLRRAAFRSPIAGQVLRIFARPGELLAQRPILQVADLGHMVCIAEVAHDQINQIHVGQTALLHSRAFGESGKKETLQGTVEQIGAMASTPELRQIDPFAPADRHSFEVRVVLGPAESAIAARFIHLQLDVQFLRGTTNPAAP